MVEEEQVYEKIFEWDQIEFDYRHHWKNIMYEDVRFERKEGALWVRASSGPDQAFRNKSLLDADPSLIGMTLFERVILGMKYFEETGKHLDVNTFTICSGSQMSTRNVVPLVACANRKVIISIWSNHSPNPKGGARSVIS